MFPVPYGIAECNGGILRRGNQLRLIVISKGKQDATLASSGVKIPVNVKMSASMDSSIFQSRSWHEDSGSNEPEQLWLVSIRAEQAHCGLVTYIWVNTGSDTGMLPDGTKPLPEPMLTHQSYSMAFTCVFRDHTFKIVDTSSRGNIP